MLISEQHPLLLGSGSPRRRELLAGLRIPLRVAPREIDESVLSGETPEQYLERIATAKMRAVADFFDAHPEDPGAVLLVADTIVVLENAILGKPRDAAHAYQLLTQLAGKTHRVMTRYALRDRAPGAEIRASTMVTEVTLANCSKESLTRYAETGEGLDKAGAYAAQGVGAFLVERISGSYTNVVGLPVSQVVAELVAGGWLQQFP